MKKPQRKKTGKGVMPTDMKTVIIIHQSVLKGLQRMNIFAQSRSNLKGNANGKWQSVAIHCNGSLTVDALTGRHTKEKLKHF